MLKAFLINNSSKISRIDLSSLQSRPGAVLNLNLYALSLVIRDIEFRTAIERAEFLHLDGVGASLIVFLATGKWYSASGYRDWAMQMFEVFETKPFLLLGGTTDESTEAKKKILCRYPKANIDAIDGYQPIEFNLQKIQEIKSGVIVVGLGMPRQEALIDKAINSNQGNLFFACGGWIKQVAGFEEDVPRIYKTFKLEWLYRSMRRPGHFLERVLNPLICVSKNFY